MLKAIFCSALLIAAPATTYAQLVPGAPTTDWDRARNEYSLSVLKQYNELINEWREKFERGEAQKAAEHYSEQGRLILAGQPPLQGRDSIGAYFDRIDESMVEIRTGLTDFVASDNVAYAMGPVVYRFRDESGATRSKVGTHVTVLARENRRWRIRTQILSYESES